MQPDEIPHRPAIEGLAYAAGASVEDCLHHGARWTLSRMLERRLALVSILVVRRLGPVGLAYAKGLVTMATRERVEALGEAIDVANTAAAAGVLEQWMCGSHADNQRLVSGLLEAFAAQGPGKARG